MSVEEFRHRKLHLEIGSSMLLVAETPLWSFLSNLGSQAMLQGHVGCRTKHGKWGLHGSAVERGVDIRRRLKTAP